MPEYDNLTPEQQARIDEKMARTGLLKSKKFYEKNPWAVLAEELHNARCHAKHSGGGTCSFSSETWAAPGISKTSWAARAKALIELVGGVDTARKAFQIIFQ